MKCLLVALLPFLVLGQSLSTRNQLHSFRIQINCVAFVSTHSIMREGTQEHAEPQKPQEPVATWTSTTRCNAPSCLLATCGLDPTRSPFVDSMHNAQETALSLQGLELWHDANWLLHCWKSLGMMKFAASTLLLCKISMECTYSPRKRRCIDVTDTCLLFFLIIRNALNSDFFCCPWKSYLMRFYCFFWCEAVLFACFLVSLPSAPLFLAASLVLFDLEPASFLQFIKEASVAAE